MLGTVVFELEILKHYFVNLSEDSFGALLTEGEHPSPLLLFHPVYQRNDYVQYDKEFYQSCCQNAKSCDLFRERRPSDNCLLDFNRNKQFYTPLIWSMF